MAFPLIAAALGLAEFAPVIARWMGGDNAESVAHQVVDLAATRVLFDNTIDCTKGANHYHSTNIAPPYWAVSKNPTVTIGHHIFYKL